MIRRLKALAAASLLLASGLAAAQNGNFDVAIYFPGDLGGNPLEPAITAGVERVRDTFENVTVRVVEGGAASDWESGAIALAASGEYELIITLTDGMPQILEVVSTLFPNQRWALLDSAAPNQENVYSLVYSDEALGFLGGAFAGLLATHEEMSHDLESPSVGLLAGTPYPAMDNKIHPGYKAGAHFVDPSIEILYAAVGDWNNPNRARDLALNMFNRGATAVMSITGGGDSGVHRAAAESDAYAIAVNTNQNPNQPGVILASVLKRLDNSIVSVVERAMTDELPYGTVETAGVEEGAISIAEDDLYQQHVPSGVRERLAEIQADMESGDIAYLELLEAELDN